MLINEDLGEKRASAKTIIKLHKEHHIRTKNHSTLAVCTGLHCSLYGLAK